MFEQQFVLRENLIEENIWKILNTNYMIISNLITAARRLKCKDIQLKNLKRLMVLLSVY